MPVIGERPEVTLDSILLATDFSEASQRATAYATQLARRYGSCLHIVSVVNLNVPVAVGDGSVQLPVNDLVESNKACLDAVVASIQGVECVPHAPESFSISNAILEVARATGAAMIVMGTTSKPAWKKVILGSTAEEVIRAAEVPVLTVGPQVPTLPEAPIPFQKIVFADDLSGQSARTLPVALAFAEDSGAQLYVCRVLGTPEKGKVTASEAQVEHDLRKSIPAAALDWCQPEYVIEHGKAPEGILELAGEIGADLIVLGARKSTFRLSYFERGVTPAVIAEAKCPVLSFCA